MKKQINRQKYNTSYQLKLLLRMNRSIQAEGAFGTKKRNKSYQRIGRRGLKSVILTKIFQHPNRLHTAQNMLHPAGQYYHHKLHLMLRDKLPQHPILRRIAKESQDLLN